MVRFERKSLIPAYLVFAAALILWHFSALLAEGKMIRDQMGREVMVPDNPQRVIALAPSIAELICSLGEQDRLVGVTQHSEFTPTTRSLTQVGSFVHPDVERIVALKPDLCIAIKEGNPRDIVAKLESLEIPVYVINPCNLSGIMASLLELGQLMGAGQKAERLVKDMRNRIERVESSVAQTGVRPKVFFQISTAPIVSAGTDTFVNELITVAGGDNLARGPMRYPRFSLEQVLKLQPEVIIITSMLKDQEAEQVRDEWNQWACIPAVRDHRVFLVDADLFDRPGFRLVEALELLSRLIHPELLTGGEFQSPK
ncbi:MAG: cobalamin-binding protein [Syntrophobacteraceae bacterium]